MESSLVRREAGGKHWEEEALFEGKFFSEDWGFITGTFITV